MKSKSMLKSDPEARSRYCTCYPFNQRIVITLTPGRIRHPPRPSNDGPVVLYLPSGLPSASQKSHNDPINTLALSANATVVRAGYRLSNADSYPKPIHDVLASYDWILKHLVPPNHSDAPGPSRNPKLGVCGELVGGSLAAMLAITECHDAKTGITAAALGNPIVDWSPPFAAPHFESTDPFHRGLISLREKSFPNAEARYDPFASPLLFFRTPAFDLPAPDYYGLSSLSPEVMKLEAVDETSSGLVSKRRSHRKYPPTDSDLRLPITRIHSGKRNPLAEQVAEFAQLIQRSIDIYEREDGGYRGASKEAQQRVSLVDREAIGLWGDSEIMEIGAWFGEVLR
ncbi:MAG: hypothetical protein Q9170_004492 [Blastenia crenularia]